MLWPIRRETYLCLCPNLSISLRHLGKFQPFWAYVCLFCLRQTYKFETHAHTLSFLCCPSFLSTCMKGSREAFTFIPSLGHFPNVLSNRCSFLGSSHPPSPQSPISLRICLANTFVCLPRFIPQLWFRRQGCSHSLPALDRVTLPLLSRSPREGALCQAQRSLPACSLPAYPDLRNSAVQPQTPLVNGLAPAMAHSRWKIVQTSERQGAGSAVVLELHFQFLVGWE